MCHLWTFLCCHVDNVLKAHFSYLSTHRSSWAVAGLWLGWGWQILFQGKKRGRLATWTRPATCGRTWDTLLIITWEGMDRNRKQIDINISAMIHTYIKLIIKRLSCHNCNDAATPAGAGAHLSTCPPFFCDSAGVSCNFKPIVCFCIEHVCNKKDPVNVLKLSDFNEDKKQNCYWKLELFWKISAGGKQTSC